MGAFLIRRGNIMASIRKEGKVYYLYFRKAGKQYKRSLHTESKREAEKIKTQIEHELNTGKFFLANYSPQTKKKLSDLLIEVIEYSKINKAPRTVEREQLVHNNFNDFCGVIFISDIDSRLIESYKRHLSLKKKFANSGINIELRHLSSAFSLAVKYEYLEKNPFKEIKKIPVPKTKPRFLNKDQAALLLEKAKNTPLLHYIMVSLFSGARISEVAQLKWANVDLQNKIIKFEGKGSRERSVPIPKNLVEYFNTLKKKNQFVAPGTKDIHKTTARFRKLADQLGLNEFKFHDLRHTYASWLVQNNVNIKVIQELLGHQDIKTTLIYTHIAKDDRFRAVKQLEEFYNEKK